MRVGLAPSTTTMRIDHERTSIPTPDFASPWNPAYPDPAQRYMPPHATIVGGAMAPHDFELARIYGYAPYMQGWTVGTLERDYVDNPPTMSPRSEVMYRGVLPYGGKVPQRPFMLGADEPVAPAVQDNLAYRLQIQKLYEEMKTAKQTRIWAGLSAAAAVGGLILGIVTLARSR